MVTTMTATETRIDSNDRLAITINNTQPVALIDLTLSLLSIGHQFERFIETELSKDVPVASELLVKHVRSGSIIFALVAQTLPFVPLLWQGGALLEWTNYAKDTIHWLIGKLDQPPKSLNKSDLTQWNNILEPVAKDHGSQLNFSVSDGGTVINHFVVNSAEAIAGQSRIKQELGRLEDPSESIHSKRVMTWYQAKFDNDSKTGNKAIIESISPKPLRVIFDNNAVRNQMFEQGVPFSKPWHELAYIVDVQIQTINGQPRVATILNFYPDETFDPGE